jgi:hypothetical protein
MSLMPLTQAPKLTLVARLRNSHLERVRYHDIRDPGVQCLEWLREYRRARDVAIEADKWPAEHGHNLPQAEADMANAKRNFLACRERMRAQGRFNRAMGEAA